MAPRLRVPAHVFGYSIAIMPAVGYGKCVIEII